MLHASADGRARASEGGAIEPPRTHVGPDDVRRYAEAVYEVHGARLHGWLIGLTRDEATAEDLTHEAFVRLISEAAAGRAPLDPGAWLHRVAANLATSRGRRIAVAGRREGELPLPEPEESPEGAAIGAEEAAALHAAMRGLNQHDRDALLLAAHGFRGAEIAARLGRSEGATRTLLCRARAKLRAQLLLSGAF